MNNNGLPRPYLSYSAYQLWKTNKDAFRRRYYEGEKSIETVETKFGKTYAEESEKIIDPRYTISELTIEVPIHGVTIHGRLDKFDPIRCKFLDEKTGHTDSKGKAPWNKVKVEKHNQLVFYSMLIKEKYGKVDPVCHLVWLETEFFQDTRYFMGILLPELGKGRKLRLTGKVKKFSRRISEWQRKKMKLDLLNVIEEIRNDYKNYKQIHESDGETLAQEVATK